MAFLILANFMLLVAFVFGIFYHIISPAIKFDEKGMMFADRMFIGKARPILWSEFIETRFAEHDNKPLLLMIVENPEKHILNNTRQNEYSVSLQRSHIDKFGTPLSINVKDTDLSLQEVKRVIDDNYFIYKEGGSDGVKIRKSNAFQLASICFVFGVCLASIRSYFEFDAINYVILFPIFIILNTVIHFLTLKEKGLNRYESDFVKYSLDIIPMLGLTALLYIAFQYIVIGAFVQLFDTS